ncbi:MAG: hypothetical protein ACRDYB_10610 [Acidimicrobiales bacterium]
MGGDGGADRAADALVGDAPHQGAAAPASFEKAAVGASFADPAWTWGHPPERLTAAYDPDGTPDAHYLIDAGGHVAYQSSVPAFAMSACLAHLDAPAAKT